MKLLRYFRFITSLPALSSLVTKNKAWFYLLNWTFTCHFSCIYEFVCNLFLIYCSYFERAILKLSWLEGDFEIRQNWQNVPIVYQLCSVFLIKLNDGACFTLIMKRFLKEYTFDKSSFGSWGMLRQDVVIYFAVFLYWTNKNTCGTCPQLLPHSVWWYWMTQLKT